MVKEGEIQQSADVRTEQQAIVRFKELQQNLPVTLALSLSTHSFYYFFKSIKFPDIFLFHIWLSVITDDNLND